MTTATLTEFGFCVSRDGRPLATYASRFHAERAARIVAGLGAVTDSGVIDALLSREPRDEYPEWGMPRPSFVHDGRPDSSWR